MASSLVSVIIPAYNAEDFIERCLYSIEAQTYENLEIILVDDGSTDDTAGLANLALGEDPRYVYLYKENGGLSSARNFGFNHAHGQYVTFVDADDYCEKDMIEKLLNEAESIGAELVICGAVREEEDGSVLFIDTLVCEDMPAMEWMAKCYTAPDRTWIVRAWGKLYLTSVIAGVPFRTGKLYEDQFFFGDVLGKIGNVSVVNEPLYHYVSHEGSIVNRPKTDRDFDAARGALHVFDAFERMGLDTYLPGAEGKIYAKMLEIKTKTRGEWKDFVSFREMKEAHMERVAVLRKRHLLSIKAVIRNFVLYHC